MVNEKEAESNWGDHEMEGPFVRRWAQIDRPDRLLGYLLPSRVLELCSIDARDGSDP